MRLLSHFSLSHLCAESQTQNYFPLILEIKVIKRSDATMQFTTWFNQLSRVMMSSWKLLFVIFNGQLYCETMTQCSDTLVTHVTHDWVCSADSIIIVQPSHENAGSVCHVRIIMTSGNILWWWHFQDVCDKTMMVFPHTWWWMTVKLGQGRGYDATIYLGNFHRKPNSRSTFKSLPS